MEEEVSDTEGDDHFCSEGFIGELTIATEHIKASDYGDGKGEICAVDKDVCECNHLGWEREFG